VSNVAGRFETGTTLTLASAKAALAAGLARIASGATGVDCAPLAQFDSSALAVLLAFTGYGAYSLDAALGLTQLSHPTYAAVAIALGVVGALGNLAVRRKPAPVANAN